MFEAVGLNHYDDYFVKNTTSRALFNEPRETIGVQEPKQVASGLWPAVAVSTSRFGRAA
jgi:hypothetical protein